MATKLIFVKAHGPRKFFSDHLVDLVELLEKCGIESGRVNFKDCIIYTENVTIRLLTSDMNWEGLRCDEAFGFNPDVAIYLRKDHHTENYKGTIMDYIREQEAKVNE